MPQSSPVERRLERHRHSGCTTAWLTCRGCPTEGRIWRPLPRKRQTDDLICPASGPPNAPIYGRDGCFTRSLFFDLTKDLKPGDVEMTPWAAAIQAQRQDRNHVDDPYGYCMPPGVPRIDFAGGPFKILQTPTVTALLYESLVGMIFRQVFTDGRPLPPVGEPTWLGYSVGRWEGGCARRGNERLPRRRLARHAEGPSAQRRLEGHGAIPAPGFRSHGSDGDDHRS